VNQEESPTRLPVDVPGFTGPLDLLVHLIAKHELDICNISITDITNQYIEVIRSWEVKDLDLAGEYLVLAATLVRYKARALLPKEVIEEEEDEEINDQILEERRKEYERFRTLADELRKREHESSVVFPRQGPTPEGKTRVVEYTEVDIYDLYSTFQKIIDDIGSLGDREIVGETYSVDEKMLEIEALLAHNNRIILTDYLSTLESKLEIIVVFLAMLELIKLKEIRAKQEKNLDKIVIEKGESFESPMGIDDDDDDDEDEDDEDDEDIEEQEEINTDTEEPSSERE
jgi:segregation and condensation protein A